MSVRRWGVWSSWSTYSSACSGRFREQNSSVYHRNSIDQSTSTEWPGNNCHCSHHYGCQGNTAKQQLQNNIRMGLMGQIMFDLTPKGRQRIKLKAKARDSYIARLTGKPDQPHFTVIESGSWSARANGAVALMRPSTAHANEQLDQRQRTHHCPNQPHQALTP